MAAAIPQLDSSVYASQIFWLVLCLAALYLFLSRVYVPRVRAVLEKRSAYVKKNLSEAEVADALASSLRQEQSMKAAEARAEAAAVLRRGLSEVQAIEERGKVAAGEKVSSIIRGAEDKVAMAVDKQMTALHNLSADLALRMYHKATGVESGVDRDRLMAMVCTAYEEVD